MASSLDASRQPRSRCYFLELPLELRYEIYGYCLPVDDTFEVVHSDKPIAFRIGNIKFARIMYPIHWNHLVIWDQADELFEQLHIFAVNRQVRDECFKLLLERNWICEDIDWFQLLNTALQQDGHVLRKMHITMMVDERPASLAAKLRRIMQQLLPTSIKCLRVHLLVLGSVRYRGSWKPCHWFQFIVRYSKTIARAVDNENVDEQNNLSIEMRLPCQSYRPSSWRIYSEGSALTRNLADDGWQRL